MSLEASDRSTISRYFGACHSVVVPPSVVVLSKSSFCQCESLESVIFGDGSRIERIEKSAFSRSGLKSIVIPALVVALGKSCFRNCTSLGSVMFSYGSRLGLI
jgi:hypothetical protein